MKLTAGDVHAYEAIRDAHTVVAYNEVEFVCSPAVVSGWARFLGVASVFLVLGGGIGVVAAVDVDGVAVVEASAVAAAA